MTVKEITDYLDQTLRKDYQESYDNSGLQVGNMSSEITGVLTCVDVSDSVVDEAVSIGANLIVSHHPLIFGGLNQVTDRDTTGRIITHLIHNNISVYSAHTNLDNLLNGVNGILAQKIGLENCRILRPLRGAMRKLETFVPRKESKKVADALFDAGAGKLGNYDRCCFATDGQGTFRPLEGSTPFCGTVNKEHCEDETRIEVMYETGYENNVVSSLLESHPYEMPAFYCLDNNAPHPSAGAGLIGVLPEPLPTDDFLRRIKKTLNIPVIRTSKRCCDTVQKVAICGGSGAFLMNDALSLGADIFLTSDIKYHDFQHATGRILLADIGHYESEQFSKELLCNVISEKFHNFACRVSERDNGYVCYI